MRFARACLLIGILTTVGCGDDDALSPATDRATLAGTVVDVRNNLPIAGQQVYAVSPATLAPLAASVVTDSTGAFAIADLPAGEALICFPHSGWYLFDRPASVLVLRPGETTRCDVRMRPRDRWPGDHDPSEDRHLRYEGTVRNRLTSAPIPGAYVQWAPPDFSYAHLGDSILYGLVHGQEEHTPAMSDAAGRYAIELIVIVAFSGGPDTVMGTYPLSVTAPGFLPGTLTGGIGHFSSGVSLLPLPQYPAETVEATIWLNPVDPDSTNLATGVIEGRLLSPELTPVAGARVGLCLAHAAELDTLGLPAGNKSAPLAGVVATTDNDGRFRLANLSPGVYQLAPAFAPDDGWVATTRRPDGTVFRGYFRIAANDTERFDDIPVIHALERIAPDPGPWVPLDDAWLDWTDCPGADIYKVWLAVNTNEDNRTFDNILSSELGVLPEFLRSGATVRWHVNAYALDPVDDGDPVRRLVGATDGEWTFMTRRNP